jgi:plasmid stability protein
MPVNLSVKNVPDDVAERLRRRAAANRRSLQRELLNILETAVAQRTIPAAMASASRGQPAPEVITIEDLAELSRKLFPQGTESSVEYIRQLRDQR